MSIPTGKVVLSTIGPSVVGQPLQHNGMRELQCSHEEADTECLCTLLIWYIEDSVT